MGHDGVPRDHPEVQARCTVPDAVQCQKDYLTPSIDHPEVPVGFSGEGANLLARPEAGAPSWSPEQDMILTQLIE